MQKKELVQIRFFFDTFVGFLKQQDNFWEKQAF
jgi:hypothetical protein